MIDFRIPQIRGKLRVGIEQLFGANYGIGISRIGHSAYHPVLHVVVVWIVEVSRCKRIIVGWQNAMMIVGIHHPRQHYLVRVAHAAHRLGTLLGRC